jgi:hypothetical protein
VALFASLIYACGSSSQPPGSNPPPGSPPPSQGFPPGVYSLTQVNGSQDASVYQNPAVAGIALRPTWGILEPQDGQFDWSYLDQQIQEAKNASKRVSIYVHEAPDWVYADGAQAFSFLDANTPVRMPVPWDPVFQQKWIEFIHAFGARYSGETTIAYTRGSTESVTNGWGMPTADSAGRSWATYGYSPQRLLQAMEPIVDAFLTSFPQTDHWAEVGGIKFESALSGQPEVFVAEQIASYGFSKYSHFGVWRENLSGCTPDPPSGQWVVPFAHPGRDGAQMLWNVQDGPTRMNKCGISPNDKQTVLMAAIKTGIAYGMPYLEIYQVDILDPSLAPVIEFAAQNLK